MTDELAHEEDALLRDLRARFDHVHAQTPYAAAPPPNLWNHVLADHKQGKENEMYATITAREIPGDVAPQSGRAERRMVSSPPHLVAAYAVVGVLLIVGVLGGLFVANDRWPNESDYAVLPFMDQPVSPEASAMAAQACDTPALTVDEVMVIVENPYVNLDAQQLNTVGFPAFLDDSMIDVLVLMDDQGEPMTRQAEADARQVADTYLSCLQHGTLGQVFAVMSPNAVQNTIFGQFPTFRSEEDIREYLDTTLFTPAADALHLVAWPDNVTISLADGSGSALTQTPYEGYPIAYIGTQGTDANGNLLAVSDARDKVNLNQRIDGAIPSIGAVSLIQYPGSDRWYVHDRVITRDISGGETETPAASPVASMEATPATMVDVPLASATIVAYPPIEFLPNEIFIFANRDVELTITNEAGLVGQALPANFTIEQLGISVDVEPGESRTITVNAPAGAYAFDSIIPGHTEMGMVGMLYVIDSSTPIP
jgi:hypothetical protein